MSPPIVDPPKPDVRALLNAAAQYKPEAALDLGVHKSLAIITCMDSRVMPAQIFGLKLGDAEYIRNAGGRVTPDVIRSLVITNELLNCKVIFLVQHTDCGGQRAVLEHKLLEERVNKLGQKQAGSSWLRSWVETLSFGFLAKATSLEALYVIKPPNLEGLENSVREDVEKLKASALIDPSIEIHGFVYDTHKGHLNEVANYLPA